MTFSNMVNLALYLHREAAGKGGPDYDRGRVNRDIKHRCEEHDIDYDKVIDRLTTLAYKEARK